MEQLNDGTASQDGHQERTSTPESRPWNDDMPVYEREDGSLVQVFGGSMLFEEGVYRVEGTDLATGKPIRERPEDFYPGLKRVG